MAATKGSRRIILSTSPAFSAFLFVYLQEKNENGSTSTSFSFRKVILWFTGLKAPTNITKLTFRKWTSRKSDFVIHLIKNELTAGVLEKDPKTDKRLRRTLFNQTVSRNSFQSYEQHKHKQINYLSSVGFLEKEVGTIHESDFK